MSEYVNRVEYSADYPGAGIVRVVSVSDKPADATEGYAPGCIWQNITSNVLSINRGTKASSNFDDVATS